MLVYQRVTYLQAAQAGSNSIGMSPDCVWGKAWNAKPEVDSPASENFWKLQEHILNSF